MKLLICFLTLMSASAFAGIVDATVSSVEVQYNLKCGEAKELGQRFFKPIRHRESISCADNSGEVKVVIQTESKAKGQPLYKVQILAANPEMKL